MEEKYRFVKPNRKSTLERKEKDIFSNKIKQEKLPIKATESKEALLKLAKEIGEEALRIFLGLPAKLQEDIVRDIESKRENGRPPQEILQRMQELIEGGYYLSILDGENSDKHHNPLLPSEDSKLMDELEYVVSEIPKHVDEMEKKLHPHKDSIH